MTGIGTVMSLDGDRAKIQVSTSAECGSCAMKSSCHGTKSGTRMLTAVNSAGASVGDTVSFEADAGRVVLSAALIWILPIIAMIVGYLVGERIGGGVVPIAAAFGFLALTFLVLKLFDRAITGGTSFYPVITAIRTAGMEPSGCSHSE